MKTFLISDTHFCHKNILTFKREDGTFLRPFYTLEEMDETLIDRWNGTVGKKDKIYHLGDVAMCNSTRFDQIMSRLNGNKILIKGNHDNLKLVSYAKWFKDVRACHVLDGIVLAHIPIHIDSLNRWRGQVHGHTHYNCLKDSRYFNVSVENTDYFPVDFEEIRCKLSLI